MREPQKLDVVIFRENIEDVYSGIEYRAGSPEADAIIGFLGERFAAKIRPGSAIGIKPMSKFGSQRLLAKAIEYALRAGRRSVSRPAAMWATASPCSRRRTAPRPSTRGRTK